MYKTDKIAKKRDTVVEAERRILYTDTIKASEFRASGTRDTTQIYKYIDPKVDEVYYSQSFLFFFLFFFPHIYYHLNIIQSDRFFAAETIPYSIS